MQNDVYLWEPATGQDVVIKIYVKTDRQRATREWAALNLLRHQELDSVPAPMWIDETPIEPAIGMTRLHGQPILEVTDQQAAARAVARTIARLHAAPLTAGPLLELPRIDSAEHYLIRLRQEWPQLLAEQADDPLAPLMQEWLTRWHRSGDDERVLEPAEKVLSRGDGNLLNWMIDENATGACVDFEYAGFSNVPFDVADLIEHISARDLPDDLWAATLPEFGITDKNRRTFAAAQRTCALRWLAVLWKRRDKRRDEFQTQIERVERLNSSSNPYA